MSAPFYLFEDYSEGRVHPDFHARWREEICAQVYIDTTMIFPSSITLADAIEAFTVAITTLNRVALGMPVYLKDGECEVSLSGIKSEGSMVIQPIAVVLRMRASYPTRWQQITPILERIKNSACLMDEPPEGISFKGGTVKVQDYWSDADTGEIIS